ncbi:MAG: transcription antitermination factor NusB [Sulfobacillus sp.]|nr:transcription antitermination factor NusB [Sulfobacillus sp.]
MARRHARELALRILFEHDLAHTEWEVLLDRGLAGASPGDADYARTLVRGVRDHLPELDRWISDAAIDWRLHRMPTVDRNILRLAAYEIGYEKEIPLSVIINEAVELAHAYSTDDSKRFVNGVLGTIGQKIRPEGDPDRTRE